ncbi:uncharacterized protein LOC124496582 isoform X2 [Dermatophagoides farinae]|uniref:uncharacterized protein LOC124496582 isoform X2 n=1 Tax=Dermatophagoides farinae TaxID=6954 RepID=UPI003F5D94F2
MMSSVTTYEQSPSTIWPSITSPAAARTDTLDPIQSVRASSSSKSSMDIAAFSNVDDDGLTSLSWLQNLNMCMTRLGAPTPPTPPASPVCFPLNSQTSVTACQSNNGIIQLQSQSKTTTTTTKIPSSVSIKSVKLTSIPSHKSKAISSSFPESSHNSLTQAINIGKVGLSNEKIFLSNGNASKMAKSSRTTNNIHHSSTDISVIGAKEKTTTTTTTTSSNKKKSSNRKSMANNVKYSKKNRANAGNSNSQQQSNGNSNAPSLNTSCYQQPHDPHDGHHQLQESQSTIVDYKVNGQIKPPFSYATLICMAMKANKNKMTLSSIYKWIKENFLYYKNADPNWQNSIRHNLSLNKCFIKIARSKDEPGKGGFWKLDPVYANSLVDGVFKKRRPTLNASHMNGNCRSNKNTSTIQENGSIVGTKKKRKKRQSSGSTAWLHSAGCINGHNESSSQLFMGYIEATTSSNLSSHREPSIEQETPPNSAESYSQQHKIMMDMNELNTAIDNIDKNNVVCSDTSYPSYTFSSTVANLVECDTSSSNNNNTASTTATVGFGNEVCVQNVQDMIETDCWNTILTDVDLSELVDPITYTDSVAQIIHPIESDNSLVAVNSSSPNPDETSSNIINVKNNQPTGTAQLRPNELDTSNLLDESHFFYDHRIHGLVFNANVPTNVQHQVISATSNVVTCINDTSDLIVTDHWDNHWTSYTSNDDGSTVQLDCDPNTSTELILGPLEQSEVVRLNEIQVLSTTDNQIEERTGYVTTTASVMPKQPSNESITTITDSSPTSTITTIVGNFDPTPPTNSIQIWDCGKALMQVDANALDLFHTIDVEQLPQF